jgi:hypothetical protein
MTKLISIIFISILLRTDNNVPLGEFYKSTGFESFRLKLTKDNLFEQTAWSCTWRYVAKGSWHLSTDTIRLQAQQLYKFIGKDKVELVDTTSDLYSYFDLLNKLVIINADTLGQIHGLGEPTIIKLPRQN